MNGNGDRSFFRQKYALKTLDIFKIRLTTSYFSGTALNGLWPSSIALPSYLTTDLFFQASCWQKTIFHVLKKLFYISPSKRKYEPSINSPLPSPDLLRSLGQPRLDPWWVSFSAACCVGPLRLPHLQPFKVTLIGLAQGFWNKKTGKLFTRIFFAFNQGFPCSGKIPKTYSSMYIKYILIIYSKVYLHIL